jgi:sterol desaturase/sphingolipid hydroxylase (fatty acid hydroxylase superfamily)
METTAYYAFGVPIYLGLVVAEWLRAKRRGARTLSFAPSFGNVSAGLGSIVVGLFLGPALLALYAFGERTLAVVHWEKGSIVPWILAIVLADFGHYWHHRLDHRVAACWAVHGVHHMPEEMNFTVAMRHAWFSDLYSFPFYAPLPLLGVPASHFFVATTILSFHALITHSEHFDFPSFGIFVTPRSHVLHHARNAPYVDTNFGAALCIWDRMFGTSSRWDDANPPEWGTHRGYATHDGALAQWVLWRDLLEAASKARTLCDKVRVFFGRPGWLPRDVTLAPVVAPPPSTTLPRATKIYVALQLVATMTFSLWVFVWRDDHSWPFKIVAAAAILSAMVTLGGVLDARPRAARWEAARLASTIALVVVSLRT